MPIHVHPVREARAAGAAHSRRVIPFLSKLTETICHRFKRVHREEGTPWPPATTIENGKGCRDLAVLWVDICRAVGLAARFVSGYYEGDTGRDQHLLHAWGERTCPAPVGAASIDSGIGGSHRDIAVAASADPQIAAPVTATYRGNNVEAELYADVVVQSQSAVQLLAC